MSSSFRSFVTAILLLALFLPPSVLSGNSDPHQTVRTTAYTHSEADHIQYGRKTALGTQLQNTRSYTSAAADWSRYPVGTTFKMKGSSTTYVIDDYGSALVGTGTIDLYHPSKSSMNRWGVRHVEIDIVKWGDFQKSREILSQRTKYPHCRQMYASIPENATPPGRTWFWQRKPKATEPAPAPLPAPIPQPQRAPEPASVSDVMLASNEEKSFGIRSWFRDGSSSDDPAPVAAPTSAQPEMKRTEPERSEVMLAANDSSGNSGENRWQWLRKLAGRDDAPSDNRPTTTPIEFPSASQPVSPAQPIEAPIQPEVMLASVEAPRTAPIPAPAAIIELASTSAPAPTPAPAEVKAAAPATVSTPAPPRVVEPIAIARVSSSTTMKVSHTDAPATQRVMFAVARPDSPVPHRKREVRALPAGWRPNSAN